MHILRYSRLALIAALLLGGLTPARSLTAAADSARLPRTDFPACSTTVNTYCVSSVTFIEAGVEKVAKWIPTGTAGIDSAGVANTKTYNTFGTTATNFTGRWSYDGFPFATRDFDGVYVRVAPANEFTDTMSLWIDPAGPATGGQVGRIKDSVTNRVGSLPVDMGIRVTIRLGDLNPAVTIAAGSEVSMNTKYEGTVAVMTFQGLPTAIAQASTSKDCDTSTSVAVAKPNQLYALVAFKNGRDPYGVDGLSGDMLITSNGTCKLSTPTWNNSTKSMEFTAAAPHFAPDGTTANLGFYRAVIPAKDAELLLGLDPTSLTAPTVDPTTGSTTTVPGAQVVPVDTSTTTTVLAPVNNATTVGANSIRELEGMVVGPVGGGVRAQAFLSASKALTVEVTENADGTTVSAARNVAFDGINFVVTATGFTYSTKTIKMRQGVAPNAPKALKVVSVARRGAAVSAKFTGARGTSYVVSLQDDKKKSTNPRCAVSRLTVSCLTKNLPRGAYTMRITPIRDGLAAPAVTKKITVP